MDITPLVPIHAKVITGYGNGAFTISGETYQGSVLVLPGVVQPWPVASAQEITLPSLQAVMDASVEILLIGCGKAFSWVMPPVMRVRFKSGHIAVECMDTGAACRTYNVLLSEGRQVAAALVAV